MATTNLPRVFHEMYGSVSRPQLAAYRKFNVSPSDHDTLVDAIGDDPRRIVQAIKDLAADNNGYYNPGFRDIAEWNETH